VLFDIFEHPWGLISAGAASAVIVLVLRVFLTERKFLLLWLIPPLIAGSGFGIDWLVETDTEQITTMISKIAQAIEAEDSKEIEKMIAADYRDDRHRSKRELMHHCRAKLSGPIVEKIVARVLEIEKHPEGVVVTTTFRMVFENSSYIAQSYKKTVFVKVKFSLAKQGEQGWLFKKIDIVEIDRQPTDWNSVRGI